MSLYDWRDVEVFVTGSSSKLFSRKIITALRGRSLSFRLFPLSLREFLVFKGFKIKEPLIEEERGKIRKYLEEYLEFGGFPEIVDLLKNLKHVSQQKYSVRVLFVSGRQSQTIIRRQRW